MNIFSFIQSGLFAGTGKERLSFLSDLISVVGFAVVVITSVIAAFASPRFVDQAAKAAIFGGLGVAVALILFLLCYRYTNKLAAAATSKLESWVLWAIIWAIYIALVSSLSYYGFYVVRSL